MAYKRENILKRIIEVQGITLENKNKGKTQLWIYDNLIKERFFISLSSYNIYLSTNAKKELKELERVKEETK